MKEHTITNIGELFFLKIRDGLLLYDKKKNPYGIAKACRNILDYVNNNSEEEEKSSPLVDLLNYSNNPKITISDELSRISTFRLLQFSVEQLKNIENILSEIGIENVKEFIEKVKSVDSVENQEDARIMKFNENI